MLFVKKSGNGDKAVDLIKFGKYENTNNSWCFLIFGGDEIDEIGVFIKTAK